MIEVSDWWRESVKSVARWKPRLSWQSRARGWQSATPIACQVVEDSTQTVRWRLTATLLLEDAPDLDIYGMRLLAFQALVGPGHSEEVQLGDFRIDTLTHGWIRQNGGRDAVVEVQATSWDKQISDAKLTVPRQIEGPAFKVIDELVHEALPGVSIAWDAGEVRNRLITLTTIEKDVWAWISGSASTESSFAKSFGVQVTFDHAGTLRVAFPPSLRTSPTLWELDGGPEGAQMSASHTVTRDGAYNAVVVKGKPDGAATFAPVVVRDMSTSSATSASVEPYANGGFGIIPMFYESNLIEDAGQAFDAGRSMLEPLLGARRTIDMSSLFDPSIRADDVGVIQTASGPTRVVLDTVTCDLVEAKMTCKARAEAGDPSLLSVGDWERASGSGPSGVNPAPTGGANYQAVRDHGDYQSLVTMSYQGVSDIEG